MKYLQIAVREPPDVRNPMHTFLIESDDLELAQLWNWNTATEGVDVILFRIVGREETYTAALEEVPFVQAYETARIDEESFYVYIEHETREADHRFREPFLDQRVLTIPPIEYAGDGLTRMEVVGRAADVQSVVDGFGPAFEVQVDRIGAYEWGVSAFDSLLTDRQREALSVAVDLGYFDVPRTASVEAVADELGCAPSTASNHLRKAQSRLARRVVES